VEAERARQSSDILRRNRKLVARLTPEVLTRQLSMRKVRRVVVVLLLVPTQRTTITIPGYPCAQAKLDEQLEVVAMRGRYRKAKRIEGKAQATGKVRRLKLMQERKAQKLQYSWYGTRARSCGGLNLTSTLSVGTGWYSSRSSPDFAHTPSW